MSIQSLLDYISVTPDIRQQGKVKHKLSAILFLTVCAVIEVPMSGRKLKILDMKDLNG